MRGLGLAIAGARVARQDEVGLMLCRFPFAAQNPLAAQAAAGRRARRHQVPLRNYFLHKAPPPSPTSHLLLRVIGFIQFLRNFSPARNDPRPDLRTTLQYFLLIADGSLCELFVHLRYIWVKTANYRERERRTRRGPDGAR